MGPSPSPQYFRRRLPDSESLEVGNAILSRWPITDHTSTVLSDDNADDGRTAVLARIVTPQGPIDVCTTQLTSTIAGGTAVRTRQVKRLREWLMSTRSEDLPVLAVVGEFNADPDADEMRRLGGYKTEVTDEDLVLVDVWRYRGDNDPGFTWRLDNPYVRATGEPWARPDYIFVAPTTAGLPQVDVVDVFGIEPVDGVHPSDHAGVVVDLRIPAASAGS